MRPTCILFAVALQRSLDLVSKNVDSNLDSVKSGFETLKSSLYCQRSQTLIPLVFVRLGLNLDKSIRKGRWR